MSAFSLLAALAMPTSAIAATGSLFTSVQGVLVTAVPNTEAGGSTGLLHGGCGAFLTTPANVGNPNCPDNLVSFSCDGTYHAKDVASEMLDQAKLAWATKRSVLLWIDDAKKHNGHCTVTNIMLF